MFGTRVHVKRLFTTTIPKPKFEIFQSIYGRWGGIVTLQSNIVEIMPLKMKEVRDYYKVDALDTTHRDEQVIGYKS